MARPERHGKPTTTSPIDRCERGYAPTVPTRIDTMSAMRGECARRAEGRFHEAYPHDRAWQGRVERGKLRLEGGKEEDHAPAILVAVIGRGSYDPS